MDRREERVTNNKMKVNKLKRWDLIARWALGLPCALGLLASASPELRASLRSGALTDYRSVISTAQGHLLGDQALFTVAKIKTRDALFLEIYETEQSGQNRFVDRIQLSDKRDGFFNFNGHATNLAVADLDGDGRPNILAPTFDEDLVGRLNVFKYDPRARGFHRSVR
jgi:hypothetical protein